MVQLFTQFAFVDQLGQFYAVAAIDQAKGDIGVWLVAKHGLAHQQLVKICIDQRPHNGINFPFMVPNPCCNINHYAMSTPARFMPERASESDPFKSIARHASNSTRTLYPNPAASMAE